MLNLKKINYYEKLEEELNKIISNEDNFIVIISEDIKTKKQLLDELKNKINFPSYFGDNWDALNDVLSDLNWIDKKDIYLFHKNLSHLGKDDLRTYLEILINITEHWEQFTDHNFIVYFNKDEKSSIEKLLSE
jgi:RNAse (barnase) inhibitor barstar